jgi:hypothetical protein
VHFGKRKPEFLPPCCAAFHAKDENRSCLLDGVLASGAELLVGNRSATIAFPVVTEGAPRSRKSWFEFALSYENIDSFDLGHPTAAFRNSHAPGGSACRNGLRAGLG